MVETDRVVLVTRSPLPRPAVTRKAVVVELLTGLEDIAGKPRRIPRHPVLEIDKDTGRCRIVEAVAVARHAAGSRQFNLRAVILEPHGIITR